MRRIALPDRALSQHGHMHHILHTVLLDLCRQWAFVKHSIAATKARIEESVASVLAGSPFTLLRKRKGTVSLDTFGQAVDEALREVS